MGRPRTRRVVRAALDTSKPLRALLVIRLSRLSDDTTSPERQRKTGETFITGKGWTVAGIAEDLDVSARTSSPFDRAELGRWLRHRRDEFDVIVFMRLDRIVRSVTDLNDLLAWGKKNGKHLASATEDHFDTSTPIGYIIAILIAWVAEMESQATSERTTSMHASFIDDGRYRGGVPSWGYRPVLITETCWVCNDRGLPCKHVGQKRLMHDPVMTPLAQDVVHRIVEDGVRPATITQDLSAKKILTPVEHYYATVPDKNGKLRKPKYLPWAVSVLVAMLRNPALMGYQVRRDVLGLDESGRKVYGKPEIVRDENDRPILRAQPIIDPVMFDRLQKKLDEMNKKRAPYKATKALLLGVLKCGVCGQNMYGNTGRTYSYYRCKSYSTGRPCGNKSIRLDLAEDFVTGLLLGEFGDREYFDKTFDPGEDSENELEQIRVTLDDLTGLLAKPAYAAGSRQRERLESQIERLAEREAKLEATPSRPAGYLLVATGKTFRDHWESMDQQEKNLFLRDHDVTVSVQGGTEAPEWHYELADLGKVLKSIDPQADVGEYVRAAEENAKQYLGSLMAGEGASNVGTVILKAERDRDLFVEWSSVVDGPTAIGTREEMLSFMIEHYGRDGEQRYRASLERADRTGTSATVGKPPFGAWDYPVILHAVESGFEEVPRAELGTMLDELPEDEWTTES